MLRLFLYGFMAVLFISSDLFAQSVTQSQIDEQLQRRQEQERADTQNRINPRPDIFTPSPAKDLFKGLNLFEETPCFVIREIEWEGIDSPKSVRLNWLTDEANAVVDRCVGVVGLKALQDDLMQRLIDRGYVTSRLFLPEQNIALGHLRLRFVPGVISNIRDSGKAIGTYKTVLPIDVGDLINQRDLDQGLENIRRLSSQVGTTFDLTPGTLLGESEIIIKQTGDKRWHGLITLDDAGSEATGRYQLGGTYILDSPLGLYDALSLSLNSNANFNDGRSGTRGSGFRWDLPMGYWLLSVDASSYRYKQTVAGFEGDIVFRGRGWNSSVGLDLTPYRSARAKGLAQLKITRKASHSFSNDAEIEVQYRDWVAYEVGFTHSEKRGGTDIKMGVALTASLPSYSKNPGFILGVTDWDGHYQILTAHLEMTLPFQWRSTLLRYQTALRAQQTDTPLPSSEFFSIGNRYTVRGFDGERSLAAENGALWRNELSGFIGSSGQSLYIGTDLGTVGGTSAQTLSGRTLTGFVLGLRGAQKSVQYDLTVGWPIGKPDGFETDEVYALWLAWFF